MKIVLKSALVAVLLSATVANAGGPVLIEEGNNELIEENSVRSAGILPVLGLLVLVCLVACGKSGGGAAPPPVVPPKG
jgi:ABC-type siderophore export system fused ATPase/permease subunit